MEKGKEVINEPFWTHPNGGKEIIMNTYITKQQIIDAFDSPDVDWYYGDVDPDSVIRVIEQIPAADVRPVVRGKWEQVDDYRYPWGCTNCRKTFSGRYNFCPNCGADMRGNDG